MPQGTDLVTDTVCKEEMISYPKVTSPAGVLENLMIGKRVMKHSSYKFQKDSVSSSTNMMHVETEIVNISTNVSSLGICKEHVCANQNQEMSEKTSRPTPVKFDILDPYLDGFDEDVRTLLMTGFKEGFKVFFEGEEVELECNNSKSAQEKPEEVNGKIRKEIRKGRMAGPFHTKPLLDFKCLPLSIREKHAKGSYMLLHNLSFPYDSRSVNHNIPKDKDTVQYSSISDAISIIHHLGSGCFLARSDISEAFRLIPLHPSVSHLMGFKWLNKYYFDKCLPMGCSSSCKLFSFFTELCCTY